MGKLFMIQTIRDEPAGSVYLFIVNAESASEARAYCAAYTEDNRWLNPSFSLFMCIGTPTEAVRPGIVLEKFAPYPPNG